MFCEPFHAEGQASCSCAARPSEWPGHPREEDEASHPLAVAKRRGAEQPGIFFNAGLLHFPRFQARRPALKKTPGVNLTC
jgi:hypothetical protein